MGQTPKPTTVDLPHSVVESNENLNHVFVPPIQMHIACDVETCVGTSVVVVAIAVRILS